MILIKVPHPRPSLGAPWATGRPKSERLEKGCGDGIAISEGRCIPESWTGGQRGRIEGGIAARFLHRSGLRADPPGCIDKDSENDRATNPPGCQGLRVPNRRIRVERDRWLISSNRSRPVGRQGWGGLRFGLTSDSYGQHQPHSTRPCHWLCPARYLRSAKRFSASSGVRASTLIWEISSRNPSTSWGARFSLNRTSCPSSSRDGFPGTTRC